MQPWFDGVGMRAKGYGIKIETLDNPDRAVSIDLKETELENRSFGKYEMDNGDPDWMVCAETEPGNIASQRVLEKAGFIPTETNGEEGPRFVWNG